MIGSDSAGEENDDYDSDNEMPRKMKLKRVAFQNEYLSGRASDQFFNKLKVAKMEEERKAGGEETWKFTFSHLNLNLNQLPIQRL